MLGLMTHGELGLVLFIFALVYVAAFVPRAGAYVGRRLAGRASPMGEAKPPTHE
jgi:hypothetical protein